MPGNSIAVIGATGRTGRPLVEALRKRGVHVLAITRDPGRASILAEQVELRQADLADAGSLTDALREASAIHYIPPSLDACDPDYLRNIIASAHVAAVPRIVYHSVLHSNTPEMPHHIRKAGCERLLRHSRLSWTVIQPAMYVQTILGYLNLEAGELAPPFNVSQPFTLIHEGDLAEAAAILHTTDGHAFATYELAGSERLDPVGMAERLSEICGQPLIARKADIEAFVARVAAARGLSADQARERKLMFEYYDRHGLVGNGNVLRMILGREPTGFADAARESLAGMLQRRAAAMAAAVAG